MSLTSESKEYQLAIKATEAIEPPAVGYTRPADYKGLATAIASIQKQNNTLIQLFTQLFTQMSQLQTEVRSLRIEQGSSAQTDQLLDQVITKLGKLSIQDKLPEKKGKLLVHKDPVIIYNEEKAKIQ
ncbi:ORF2 protein [Dioscorea bacilliform SN virus]|uniref:ORF2 protein n=1 Tax=Dioscorea bacilliform SN virus TaxID=1755696 RepID=A2T396_9VIRU|nr:ORF2 protein [Dioscorea bacilliform virus]ABI47982.1 ORF2 protein [Dioscorea bacilliform SN virus]